MAYDLELDMFRAMCAAAWILFALIMKNVVLLVILAVQRRKNAMYKVPEDVETFSAAQQHSSTDDWSLAGRIQRVLANDTEYIPYFIGLLIFFFCGLPATGAQNQHHLARVLTYGLFFTLGRYLHTIGYLAKRTYIRIAGFLITIIFLFVISIDHVYYVTKALNNYKSKP
ncbi:unnamed protein product [Adineta ricciae]|uniref:Uncharacterized protein n=1 Tax=Adineta ricciae TaxID=249248 RepID=A0A816EGI1_ADIRI|nr:unnamed protein product [Adineta ricciae]